MEPWIFFFVLIMDLILLFTMVFYVVMISDLECDMVNPVEMCQKFVLPEFILHAVMTALLLLTGNWTAFLWNLPLLAYHGWILHRHEHWYDPTEIFPQLTRKKIESFGKLAFFLLSFFYYMYRLVFALVHHTIHH